MGMPICKWCQGSTFHEDSRLELEVCDLCGAPRAVEETIEGHENQIIALEISSAKYRIPPPSERSKSTGIPSQEGHTYEHENPNYKAMRKAREFLGLSKKARSSILEEDLCPPFHKSHSTFAWDMDAAIRSSEDDDEYIQKGKERVYSNDIDSIVARKFWSLYVNGLRTRPLRKCPESKWGSREADWITWELYVHLTIGNIQPWFISKWIEKHGLSDKFLKMGGPCSRECVDFLRNQSPNVEGINGMISLLIGEGMDIPNDTSFCTIAKQIYESTFPHIGELEHPSLSLNGKELLFHAGKLVSVEEDGSELWDELNHSNYRMYHIPMTFAILQGMSDSKLHRTSSYSSLYTALENEIRLYTTLHWDDCRRIWSSAMQSIGKVAWCQD